MVSGPAFSPAAELQRAAELLFRYWTLALPTAIASFVLGLVFVLGVLTVVVTALFGHFSAGHVGSRIGLETGLIIFVALTIPAFLALYVAQAVVIHAAEDVLADRPPRLWASLMAIFGRLPELLVAFVACLAIWFVPAVLSVILIGLPLLVVAGYFTMYVPAAVIAGGEGGVQAVATSFRIASRHVGPSIIAWLGMLVAIIVSQVANAIFVHLPVINLVVPFAIGGLTSAYSALVGASFYGALRDDAPGGGMTATATPGIPIGGPPQIIR